MITLFNRTEVCATFSMEEQMRVRNALSAAGIGYLVRVNSRNAGSRAHTGALGTDASAAYEYRIFVKKDDLDAASAAIR